MLTLFLPPILGLVLQVMIFRRKDRQVQRKPYTLGRNAYAACLFGLWFQIAITIGLAGWVEGILFQQQLAWMIWGMWCVALVPTVARRLQHLGWSAWPALLYAVPIVPEPGFVYLIVPLLVCALLLIFATKKKNSGDRTEWSSTFHRPDVPADGGGRPIHPAFDTPATDLSVIAFKAAAASAPSAEKSGPVPPPLPAMQASSARATPAAGRLDLITQSPFTENRSSGGSSPPFATGGHAEPDLRRSSKSLGLITCAHPEGDGQTTIGPYELPIILHLWDSGHVRPDALYWHAQLPRWLPLADDVEMLRRGGGGKGA